MPLIFTISPSHADADSKSESLLTKMEKALHPEGLESFICSVKLGMSVSGMNIDDFPHLAALKIPDVELNITYIAPYDFRFVFSDGASPGGIDLGPMRLRGDDPLLLSNPAMKQALLAVYDAEYLGENFVGVDLFDVIEFTPRDDSMSRHQFKLYLRDEDHIPVFTIMEVPIENETLIFVSQVDYIIANGYRVPGKITTLAEFENGGEIKVTTDFDNHVINKLPDAIEMEQSDEVEDSGEFIFADIYHGFEKPHITIALSAKSDPFKKLNIAFALETTGKPVFKELDKKKALVIEQVKAKLDGRDLGELENRSFEVGRELIELINSILEEGGVSDFYFTTFEPMR